MPTLFSRSTRPAIWRFIFLCTHPHFGEDRMLDQRLFRRKLFDEKLLSRNECTSENALHRTKHRALSHLYGDCDFLRTEEISSFTRSGGLRPGKTTCVITRMLVEPEYEFILEQVQPESYLRLSNEVRSALLRVNHPERMAAE